MTPLRSVFSRLALAAGLLGLPLGCTGPDYPTCENDEHCRRDGRREWCVQGRCQQCRSNGDCGPERTCLRNRCVAGANACEGDNDCLVNQRCDVNSHSCVARAECDDNRPCPLGRHCDLGRCLEDAAPPTDPVDNRGPQCNLDPPLFAYDDNQLDEFARQVLQRWAECLQRERTSRYVLIGRCDSRGGAEYNLSLGERRARAVQRYLLGLGVLPERLAVSSEGAEGAVGTDEDGYRRDRRVDFRARP